MTNRLHDKYMPWFVYIATAHTGRYYVGITTDPQERIRKHNIGDGSKFAVNQGPFILSYVSDSFTSKPPPAEAWWLWHTNGLKA